MDDFGAEWGSWLDDEEQDPDVGGYYDYGGDVIESLLSFLFFKFLNFFQKKEVDSEVDSQEEEEEEDDDSHEECASSFRLERSSDDKAEEVKKREKWIEHYSSSQRIVVPQPNFTIYDVGGIRGIVLFDGSLEEDVKELDKGIVSISNLEEEEEEEQEEEVEKREEIWIGHYSSSQRILLVGEGNYSFSISLAKAFRSARNIVATSLDSLEDLGKKYSDGVENVRELEEMGGLVLLGLDATQMSDHYFLATRNFDCIVYNFPHVGFHFAEDNGLQIKMNKMLVKGFLRNAKVLLKKDTGEIHVTHKNGYPYDKWDLEKIAQEVGLVLHETIPFDKQTYPGYFNKRGHGKLSRNPFPLGLCTTYKFRLPQRSRQFA